jgi:hypothetical protein
VLAGRHPESVVLEPELIVRSSSMAASPVSPVSP